MKLKYFGSRVPVANFLLSKLIYGSFQARVKYLRFKNKIKEKKINKAVTLVNNEELRSEFNGFLEQGITKVNIGGGQYNLEGYVNIDFVKFPQVKNGIVANILDLTFIPDNSLTHVYSNQVMEHLTKDQLLDQFRQYKRILKKEGIISFRTPNALGVCYGFWFGQIPENNQDKFIKSGYPKDAFFYDPRDKWYHKDFFGLVHWIYADAGNIRNQHLSIFTPTKIKNYLQESGFEILEMTEPETSQIIVIAKINDENK